MTSPSERYPAQLPARWDHGSGDCDVHGSNVSFRREHKSAAPMVCSLCDVLCEMIVKSVRRDRELLEYRVQSLEERVEYLEGEISDLRSGPP